MQEQSITICNQLGLHARSASKLVAVSSNFLSDVHIIYNEKQANGKSIMDLLMLAAKKGESLNIQCTGEDENEAISAIIDLISNGFGEE